MPLRRINSPPMPSPNSAHEDRTSRLIRLRSMEQYLHSIDPSMASNRPRYNGMGPIYHRRRCFDDRRRFPYGFDY